MCSAEDPHCLKRLAPMPPNLPKKTRPHLQPSQCSATPRHGLGTIATMAPPKVQFLFGALVPAGGESIDAKEVQDHNTAHRWSTLLMRAHTHFI